MINKAKKLAEEPMIDVYNVMLNPDINNSEHQHLLTLADKT